MIVGKVSIAFVAAGTGGIFVFAKSSRVIVVPLALFNLPPLRTPAFRESDISIIFPHLTVTPASIVVEKTTDSPEFCSLYKNHFPNLLA